MTVPPRTAIDSEALGAFAHDVRTPLNAASMVVEVARRMADGKELTLDQELAEMLLTSVKEIERLVSDLQDVSRIERGKQRMAPGPASLADVMDSAREMVADGVVISGEIIDVTGPWDRDRLGRMLSDLARAANRCGDFSSDVRVACDLSSSDVIVRLTSGSRGTKVKEIASDTGWGYFRARALVIAMGGNVEAERTERFMEIRLTLPL